MLSDDAQVATKAFHAISCIVRSYEPALAYFIDVGGLECVLGLIQSNDNEKIVIKSMFLINSFSQDFPAVRDELVKLNAVERVIATIQPIGEYNTRLEQTLAALDTLTATKDAVSRCRNDSLQLREKLDRVIFLGHGKPECEVG
jgi:hsp70-interacting protein